jgi:hypothetical protein
LKELHGAAECHASPQKRKSLILNTIRVAILQRTEFLRSTTRDRKEYSTLAQRGRGVYASRPSSRNVAGEQANKSKRRRDADER